MYIWKFKSPTINCKNLNIDKFTGRKIYHIDFTPIRPKMAKNLNLRPIFTVVMQIQQLIYNVLFDFEHTILLITNKTSSEPETAFHVEKGWFCAQNPIFATFHDNRNGYWQHDNRLTSSSNWIYFTCYVNFYKCGEL